jgi:PAS domain S-box-containing protein
VLAVRRQAERTAAHFRLLLEQLPFAFLWTTDAELRIAAAAGGALTLLGIEDAATVIGRELAVLVERNGGDAAIVDAHLRALSGLPTTFTQEWRGRAFEVHVEPVFDGAKVDGVSGIAFDVTKRKLAERALAESEARFRTLVERLPIVTYVNALGFPIQTTYMSPHVEQLLGYPAELWLQPDFFPTKLNLADRDRVLDAVNRTHEEGTPFREEYRLMHAEGRDVWVLDETAAVADEQGRPLFLQGFLLDVSDRYRRRAF